MQSRNWATAPVARRHRRRRIMHAMKLVVLSLVISGSALAAQETLPTVEVRSESENSLFISCLKPEKPSRQNIAKVLSVADEAQIRILTPKLMGAAANGCKAGIAKIVVTRNAAGNSLTWEAAP